MADCSEILVLIAEEKKGTLCANTNGVTKVLRSIDRISPMNDICGNGDHAPVVRHVFACELMMALCRGTGERAYDGVVIFAEEPMMDELRRVRTGRISRMLIAEVIGKSFARGRFPGISAANAELVYRGAVH